MSKKIAKKQTIKITIDVEWGNQTRQDRAIQALTHLMKSWKYFEEFKNKDTKITTNIKYADK